MPICQSEQLWNKNKKNSLWPKNTDCWYKSNVCKIDEYGTSDCTQHQFLFVCLMTFISNKSQSHMMEEKDEKCFYQALIISFFYFFLSKNRIQDYVLGFQPLLDITEAKSEPSQPSGAGCTLSKWIHKIWILKTSNCPNEKRLCINFEDHRLWNRPSKSFETRHKALHFKRSWAAWNAVIKTT